MEIMDSYNIRLENIRIFTQVAKNGSITKTAQELHYTQPQISKAIFSLENELGLILFFRNKNGLSLTPAGRYLYERWDSFYITMVRNIYYAQQIQQNRNRQFFVGCVDGLAQNELIRNMGQKLNSSYADLYLNIELHGANQLYEQLENRTLDIIFLSRSDLVSGDDCSTEIMTVAESPLALYYNKENHPQMKRPDSLAEIAGENFICLTFDTDSNYKTYLCNLFSPYGISPRIYMYVYSVASVRMNIEIGNGMALLSSACDISSPVIGKHILEDYPCEIFALWKADNPNPLLKNFLSLLKQNVPESISKRQKF